MIGRLTGTIDHKSPQALIIDVGGVGYAVTVSLTTFTALADVGASVSLMIHTHVREDALVLYGFADAEERALFQRLLGVSGVGPKVALAILSGLPPAHLVHAITTEDAARLNAIPGVGRKTAERIIVDLKDKLMTEAGALSRATTAMQHRPMYDDALSALTNLGYTKLSAEMALRKIDWSGNVSLDQAIRSALKELVPQ